MQPGTDSWNASAEGIPYASRYYRIMMLLGIMGEYIGRIYISINNAPQYVIREMAGIEKQEPDNL